MKAIVLSCDRYRPITQHMILQYERLWPDHPFVFRVPYQLLAAPQTPRLEFIRTPPEIRATALKLLEDLDDDEWVYWSIDDKYPVRLIIDKIGELMTDAVRSPDIAALLFCRRGPVLENPELTLYSERRFNSQGQVYLERKGWHQIWLHQFIKVKVLRYLFTHLPHDLASPKLMDYLKDEIPKPPEYRLLVTEENFAIFGESTTKGAITKNCYESIKRTNIALPKWFRRPSKHFVMMGEL